MSGLTLHKLQNGNDAVKGLVFVLHGYGDSGIGILSALNSIIHVDKGLLFIAPDAPEKHSMYDGYQWFGLDELYSDPKNSDKIFAEGLSHVNYLYDLIISEAAKHNVSLERVFLIGFSQGSFIASHIGLTLNKKLGGIISLSGGIAPLAFEYINKQPINSGTKFCIIHGEDDTVVSSNTASDSAVFLRTLNISYELHILDGLAHSIDNRVLRLITNFLKSNL